MAEEAVGDLTWLAIGDICGLNSRCLSVGSGNSIENGDEQLLLDKCVGGDSKNKICFSRLEYDHEFIIELTAMVLCVNRDIGGNGWAGLRIRVG